MMYSLNEVSLLPSMHPVNINHRSEVNPFDENGKLPVFVSPMTCIIDDNNYKLFKDSKFIPIVPRNIMPNYITPNDWIACSLQDFEEVFMKYDLDELHILIDIANGHMERLYKVAKEAKSKFPDLKLMVGNIAHPQMYIECFLAGVDYVRVGIGGGNACFIDGTKVSMSDGNKKSIEHIKIGDCVKTLQGEGFVTDITRYKTSKTVNVVLENKPQLTCTENHKFLVINEKDKEKVTEENLMDFAFWVEAKDLNSNYLVIEKS